MWVQKLFEPIFGYPSIIRFSWKTTSILLDNYGVSVTWPYDTDDGNHKLKKRKSELSIERSRFFTERNLNIVKNIRLNY